MIETFVAVVLALLFVCFVLPFVLANAGGLLAGLGRLAAVVATIGFIVWAGMGG